MSSSARLADLSLLPASSLPPLSSPSHSHASSSSSFPLSSSSLSSLPSSLSSSSISTSPSSSSSSVTISSLTVQTSEDSLGRRRTFPSSNSIATLTQPLTSPSANASSISSSSSSRARSSLASEYQSFPHAHRHARNASIAGTTLAEWRAVAKERLSYAREHWKHEAVLLRSHWKTILIGLFFQYVHGVATNVAYYMHVPREPLADLGFSLLAPLTPRQQIISEYVFFTLFAGTLVFALSPFFCTEDRRLPVSKRRFTTVIIARFLGVCVLAQTLRIICFLVTTLPGPNYHCRPDSPNYDPPRGLKDIFTKLDPFHRCGDLVFSSHTIFMCLCALTLTQYARISIVSRVGLWCYVVCFTILAVSARKHYTLDCFIALYTVPLLWIAYDRFIPDKLPPQLLSNDELFAEEAAESCELEPMAIASSFPSQHTLRASSLHAQSAATSSSLHDDQIV